MTDKPPIHLGTINDRTVRFFFSPRSHPDTAWISAHDLLDALRIPPEFRHECLFGTSTVRHGDALIPIIDRPRIEEIIEAAIARGFAPSGTDLTYRAEAVRALEGLTADWSAAHRNTYLRDVAERLCANAEAMIAHII